MHMQLLKQAFRVGLAGVLSSGLLVGVCAAEGTDSQDVTSDSPDGVSDLQDAAPDTQDARATLNCSGHEIYDLCAKSLSDCESYTHRTSQLDGCMAGGYVPIVCGSSYWQAVSYHCP